MNRDLLDNSNHDRSPCNVDQTSLQFSFTSGGTYVDNGKKMCGVQYCTAHITDGEPRVKPLLIISGKKQLSEGE